MQPDWFIKLTSQLPEHRTHVVADAVLHYQHWPAPGKPGLVFVHGHAAHAHWWDFIAPAFTDTHDVIAIDQSGAGDSAHRDTYSARLFAQEIIACSQAAGLEDPVIVGHSFGGSMARIAAYCYPRSIGGVVIVDAALPEHRSKQPVPSTPRGRTRYYRTLDEAKLRFRLRPPQPRPADYIIDYIAGHSIAASDKGFHFKLDPAVFARMHNDESLPAAAAMVRSLTVPVGFIYGDASRFFATDAVRHLKTLIDPALLRAINEAHHHVFLDQPLNFVSQLKSLLTELSVTS